jgi:hypothetical protein
VTHLFSITIEKKKIILKLKFEEIISGKVAMLLKKAP